MRWVWFSLLSILFFSLAWGAMLKGWDVVSATLGLTMLTFGLVAAGECVAHYREINSVIFARTQEAVNRTPVVLIAESLRGLHPENVKLLSKFIAQTVWDVEVDLTRGERDWMLRGYDVHFGFIEFVLDNSFDGRLYPRNRFIEGSKKWDPNGLVEDREQHRQFEQWLSSRLIVVREFGDNHPALFLPPWTPAKLKKLMGFDGPSDLYRPEDGIMVQELGAVQTPSLPKNGGGETIRRTEDLLSDEDLAKINEIQAEHDRRYSMSVNEYVALKQKQSIN